MHSEGSIEVPPERARRSRRAEAHGARLGPAASWSEPEARKAKPMNPTTLASFQRPVVVTALSETVAEAARRLRDERVGCLVVTRDGRPIGIVTDRDLALRVVAEERDPKRT